MSRIIGIQHRVKQTKDGEARPTKVTVLDGKVVHYTLTIEQDELDWVHDKYPLTWRNIGEEDLLSFSEHLRREKSGQEEDAPTIWQVPDKTDGLRSGDVLLMTFGGSGDLLAAYASVRADAIGAKVLRISPAKLKEFRGEKKTENDAYLLIQLYQQSPELFFPITARDRSLIATRFAYFSLVEAQRARIGCSQRLTQASIGNIFCDPQGIYPDGSLESACKLARDNDVVLSALITAEARAKKHLEKLLKDLDVYTKLFEPIKGVGPMIAARLIVAVGNIHRFRSAKALKAFCGVHISLDGKFIRSRKGGENNYNHQARQALYLLADQFEKRPDSEWGERYLAIKAKFREIHPETEIVAGKKRYNPGHIRQMAKWRTVTKFVEWLYREWSRLEKQIEAEAIKAKAAA